VKVSGKILGKPKKGDTRSTGYYLDDLQLRATREHEPYMLAAINRAIQGDDEELWQAIAKAAGKCVKKHQAVIGKANGK
jgi:hypothetical protein